MEDQNLCTICGEVVPPSLAVWHEREFHVDDRTVSTCQGCGAVFGTPQLLQSHLDADDECRTMYNRGRTLPGRYSCEKCGLRLDGGEEKLLVHLGQMHSGEKRTAICALCGKHFFHPLSFFSHWTRIHPEHRKIEIGTGECPDNYLECLLHQCLFCKQNYRDLNELSEHQRSHHPSVGQCVRCEETPDGICEDHLEDETQSEKCPEDDRTEEFALVQYDEMWDAASKPQETYRDEPVLKKKCPGVRKLVQTVPNVQSVPKASDMMHCVAQFHEKEASESCSSVVETSERASLGQSVQFEEMTDAVNDLGDIVFIDFLDEIEPTKVKMYRKRVRPLSSFQCVYCFKTFPLKPDMLLHVAQSHNKEAAKCYLSKACTSFFQTSEERDRHILQTHPDGLLQCRFCPGVYDLKSLVKHCNQSHASLVNVGANGCQVCGAVLNSKALLVEHLVFCLDESGTRSVPTKLQRLMANHVVTKRRQKEATHCELCGLDGGGTPLLEHVVECVRSRTLEDENFRRAVEADLKTVECRTFRRGEEDDGATVLFLTCLFCRKSFGRQDKADEHVRSVHGVPLFSLDFKMFLQKHGVLRRLVDAAGNFGHRPSEVEKKQSVSLCADGEFVKCPVDVQECVHCGLSFQDRLTMAQHVFRVHSDKLVRCPFPDCVLSFLDKQQQQLHFVSSH